MVDENDSEGIEKILEAFREGDRIYRKTRHLYNESEENEPLYQKARALIERALELEEIAKQVFFNCPKSEQTYNEIILLDTVIKAHLKLGEESIRVNDYKTANAHFNSIGQIGEIVLEYDKQQTNKSFNIKTSQIMDRIRDIEEEFGERSREATYFMTEWQWVIDFPTIVRKAMYQGYQLAAYASARSGNILEAANQTVKAITFVQGKKNHGFMPEEFIPPNIRTDGYRKDNLEEGVLEGLYSQEKTYENGMLASPGLFGDHEKWIKNKKLSYREQFKSQITNRRKYIEDRIWSARQLFRTDKEEAFSLMFEAIATDPTLVKSYVLLMDMYSSIGNKEKKSEVLEAIVKLISGKSSIGDYDAGNPNPDYRDVWQMEDFISKADDEQNAKKQHGLMNYLMDSSEDKGKYPESYGYRKGLDGKVYLVTAMAGRKTLRDAINDGNKLDMANRGLEALANFRATVSASELRPEDYGVNVENLDYRKRAIKLPEVAKKDLDKILDKLESSGHVLSHCDPHLGNFTVGKNNSLTIIDYDRAAKTNVLFDPTFFVSQYDFGFDVAKQRELLDGYIGNLREKAIETKDEEQLFYHNSVYINLAGAAFFSSDRAKVHGYDEPQCNERRKFYLNNALESLEHIGNENEFNGLRKHITESLGKL